MSTEIDTNNGHIFHSAASLLRKDIETLKRLPNFGWIVSSFLIKPMPSYLLQFILCLLNANAHSQDYSQEMAPEKLWKCNCWGNRFCFTPFHLGLALQMYHEFGSKHLVETLNANGFYAS